MVKLGVKKVKRLTIWDGGSILYIPPKIQTKASIDKKKIHKTAFYCIQITSYLKSVNFIIQIINITDTG